MMKLTKTVLESPYPPDNVGPPGTESWAKMWRFELAGKANVVKDDPVHAAWLLEKGQAHTAWRLLKNKQGEHFADFATFAKAPSPYGLGVKDPEVFLDVIERATGKEGLKMQLLFAAAEPTRPVGAPEGSRNNPSGKAKPEGANPEQIRVSSESKPKYGTDPAYLAGRIKAKAEKDPQAAEVAAKVERGEYTSMRQAARDAGVLKPVDPVEAAVRKAKGVPPERWAEFMDRLRVVAPI